MPKLVEPMKGFTYCPACGKQALHLNDCDASATSPDIIYEWWCMSCHLTFKEIKPAPKGII